MDGYEWQSLRNELAPSASLAVSQSDLLGNESKFKVYLDCYWQYFHPLFPILHYPTITSSSPPPALAVLMVVLGAQFSSRFESKIYSTFMYESCVRLVANVSKSFFFGRFWLIARQHKPVTAHSCLSDIQTVILLEAFSRHRAREAKLENIPMSSRFRALYKSVCSILLD